MRPLPSVFEHETARGALGEISRMFDAGGSLARNKLWTKVSAASAGVVIVSPR
jgi:hypothetical protein